MAGTLRRDEIQRVQMLNDPLELVLQVYHESVIPVPEAMVVDDIYVRTKAKGARGELTAEEVNRTLCACYERLTMFAWGMN